MNNFDRFKNHLCDLELRQLFKGKEYLPWIPQPYPIDPCPPVQPYFIITSDKTE